MSNDLQLRFGSFRVAVAADDKVTRRLQAYFQPFVGSAAGEPDARLRVRLCEPPDAVAALRQWDGRGKESFADLRAGRLIRKDRTGLQIEVRGRSWRVSGDVRRNVNQVINIVANMYGLAMLDRGGAMLHASAVARNGRAIAIIGQSGSGKSSAAVRLLERGCDFLTNDRLIVQPVDAGVLGCGLPKLPRVNPGTLLGGRRTGRLLSAEARRRYAAMPSEELWRVEEKHDLDVEQTLGRRWLLTAPLGAALVLSWRPGQGDLAFDRMAEDDAAAAMRGAKKTFGAFDLKLASRTDDALDVTAARVPVYRVTGEPDPAGLAGRIIAKRSLWQPRTATSTSSGRVKS